MSIKKEIEVLDEALLYLNEGKSPDKQKLMEKTARAIRTYFTTNGINNISTSVGKLRGFDGAKANKDFVYGKSKYFVVIMLPVRHRSHTSSYGSADNDYSTSYTDEYDSSGLAKAMPIVNSKKKEIENFIYERTGTKVRIKVGDNHAVSDDPTIVVTVV